MNLPAALYVIRWLVRDTFRQARVSGILWLMLGASLVCTLVCSSVGIVGGRPLHPPGEPSEFFPRTESKGELEKARAAGLEVVGGELTLAFGSFRVELGRDAADAVHFLQWQMAFWAADTAGILLLLLCTAWFVPAFLEPASAAVLLARPVPRWALLLGKYLGVVAFVAFQVSIFVAGTWLALALRTGVWDGAYLWCVPLAVLHFAVFFSVSCLLAVWTRSLIACAAGSIGFWFLCWGMNFARHAVVALPALAPGRPPLPAFLKLTVEAGYWLFPKPADLNLVLYQALNAGQHFGTLAAFEQVQRQGAFSPELSVFTSLLFAAAVLAAASWRLATTDY